MLKFLSIRRQEKCRYGHFTMLSKWEQYISIFLGFVITWHSISLDLQTSCIVEATTDKSDVICVRESWTIKIEKQGVGNWKKLLQTGKDIIIFDRLSLIPNLVVSVEWIYMWNPDSSEFLWNLHWCIGVRKWFSAHCHIVMVEENGLSSMWTVK